MNNLSFLIFIVLFLFSTTVQANENFILSYQSYVPIIQEVSQSLIVKGKEESHINVKALVVPKGSQPYSKEQPIVFSFTLLEVDGNEDKERNAKIKKLLVGKELECIYEDGFLHVYSDNKKVQNLINDIDFDEFIQVFFEKTMLALGCELEPGAEDIVDLAEYKNELFKYKVQKVSSDWVWINYSLWDKEKSKDVSNYRIQAKFNRGNAFINEITEIQEYPKYHAINKMVIVSKPVN